MTSKLQRKTALRLAALASASLFALPAAAQTAGPVKPFYGNLRPFYGNLRPFYGNLRPFYGNLRPFWGNLRPFWGDTPAFYGDLSKFWGVSDPAAGMGGPNYLKIGDFWTTTGGTWDQIATGWDARNPATAAPGDYQPVADQLKGLVGSSRDFWGAAVQAKTGKGFDEAFANPLLAKYGIDLNDPSSLSKLDPTDRAMFFLDWYDGLMDYAGTDHVDHWMKTVNWSPALVRTAESGPSSTVIGLLDMTVVGDSVLQKSIVKSHGVSDFTNGHGVAVAGLMVGAQDGQGVMGVAPGASVVAYNPFDASGTANWSDITKGVQMLKAEGANVVNASLGVPGVTFDSGWNKVFTDLSVTLTLKNTVFVMAAGNEGVTQTANIPWGALNPAFIVVGSVDVNGNISNFSNRPGNACLTQLLGLCLGDKLMNHFIVAPGELILVPDGNGGVTRQIGTSFAAPLVSGAVALLQERWPWLANFPLQEVDIILRSAKDLGAPGVDPVYGRGLLDIQASQSPLDMNSLIWFSVQNGLMLPQSSKSVLTTYQAHDQASWDAKNAYFYAYEPIGLTLRDFAIPLSSKLVGQNVTGLAGQQQFQAYLLSRMDAWAASGGKNGYVSDGVNGFMATEVAVGGPWGGDATLTIAPRAKRFGFRDEGPAFQSRYRLNTERASFMVGFGDGAPALASSGFVQAADYDSERGGANPLLGLASGGVYAGGSYELNGRLHLSGGFLARQDHRDTRLLPMLGTAGNGAERYGADAELVNLTYSASQRLSLNVGYTRLREDNGLLGIQSMDAADLAHGATTDAVSLGATWAVSPKLSVMAIGTFGKTRSTDAGQSLAVDRDGLASTAYAVGFAGRDLAVKGDRAQITLSQPMHVERGHLDFQSVQVVDRQTGELGIVTQNFDVSGQRRLAGEALYARPLAGDKADVALFGRVERDPGGPDGGSYMAGARYRIRF